MKMAARFTVFTALLTFLAGAPVFAESVPGYLVDSNCYQFEQNNRNATQTIPADVDVGWQIRYCHPTRKTTAFGVVDAAGTIFRLDAAGDAAAEKLVDQVGKQSMIPVVVTGERAARGIKTQNLTRR